MTKRMLIDAAYPDETRVVMLNHDQVYDYDFVTSAKTQNKGNIYLAKITRVEPSLQAAFVEYGNGKQGFLPFSEIHPDYYQLPAEDKQKLLEEQIAEAEAEEAAEDEAFEREQAAREIRRRQRHFSDGDGENEDDDFLNEEEVIASHDTPPSSEAAVALTEAANPDADMTHALMDLPPVEVPADFAPAAPMEYQVKPLAAEQFATRPELADVLPEDSSIADSFIIENATTEETAQTEETSAESGEEVRSRGAGRSNNKNAFHRRYRIQEVIKRNQIVLVQVIKEERGNKGCSLTTFISLAGRAAVLMPNSPKGGGISRKITDRETRRRLKEVAAEMRTHRGMSVIIRTAGLDRTKAEIRRDYEYLVKLWNQIREQTLASTAPALIYEEGNLVKRSLRDLYTSDVSEIIIEGEAAFQEAKTFMRMLMPSHAERVKLYKDTMPLFSFAGVEEQLSGMTEPQVRLPSGGYLVIHPTEALISIDVNSGRSTTERNVEETALKTNLEAAAEVARQLRLRDLAGLIVIDFIDMNYGKNRKAVERTMKDALRADRAKIQLGRISMFGLMELSRQRLRPSISESMGVMCPHCKGTGYIHSVETVGIQIIRTLEKEAASAEYTTLRVTTHPDAALYLLNEKRQAIQAIETRYSVSIAILMDASMITGNHRLVKITSEGKEILHVQTVEDGKRRGGRSRRGGQEQPRGGRGGRERAASLNFEGVVETTPEDYVPDPDDAEDNEIIGAGLNLDAPETSEGGRRERHDRGDRGDRGERSPRRGGRGGKGRDRNRGDRPDRTPRDPAQVAEAVEGGEAAAELPPALDEHGNPILRERGERDRTRRRGRRGGRGRNHNRSRFEEGSIGNPVTASTTEAAALPPPSAAPAPDRFERFENIAPSSRDTAAPVIPSSTAAAAKPSFVIPLSEKQTNPEAVASPILSQSSGTEGSPKRKGWWSRVLEN